MIDQVQSQKLMKCSLKRTGEEDEDRISIKAGFQIRNDGDDYVLLDTGDVLITVLSKERRAFLFCQEDRAILCKDCDVAIHWANQVTRNHQRFLLTGVKLSSAAAFSLSSLPNSNSHLVGANNVSSTPVSHSPSVAESSTATASAAHGCGSMNGVAEYLIEPLPEWHFEEFLDSSSTTTTNAPPPHPLAFSKSDDGDCIFPFVDAVVELEITTDSLSLEHWRISTSVDVLPLCSLLIRYEVEMEKRNECSSDSDSGGDSTLVDTIKMFLKSPAFHCNGRPFALGILFYNNYRDR
ncbi:hypothetical protein Csa_017079 [Cucumis sativus]|nr:hypothetical protein Csa_017079 [Cucumis sativus]